jgi:hypothetical protein
MKNKKGRKIKGSFFNFYSKYPKNFCAFVPSRRSLDI